MKYHRYSKGITLIELLVVILIIGVLAGVGVPMYTQAMVRARRSDAKTVLEQVRAAQEMWRAERGTYAVDAGGNTAETILTNTMGVPASPINTDYTWAFTVKTAATFTAQATPVSARQQPDGWLAINQAGAKTAQFGPAFPDPQSRWSR